MDFTSSGEYWVQVRTEFPPWSWHKLKYHRFVLLKPYLCSNALHHSCHSPRYHFPWGCPKMGLSQNQGVLSRTGGKVGKQHTLFSIETQTTWYQRFTCSSLLFSQREGSFRAYCILRKLFKLFSFHMYLRKSGCPKAAVLRIGIAFCLENSPPQLGSQWKVPVNVRICLGFARQTMSYMTFFNIKKQSLNWTPIF